MRIIEWNLPLTEISKNSSIEKSIRHGHPSTLHIWWARRPLAASRATNFAALIDLPDSEEEREKTNKIITAMLPWTEIKSGNSEAILKAQKVLKHQWKENPPLIIDPFTGGGSIPLEALRLGCDIYSNDLNPVAVFIQKATLEWPHLRPEISNGRDSDDYELNSFLLEQVKYWANKIQLKARNEIGMFYPIDPDGWMSAGYIWARTIPCSNENCQAEFPLIKHFWLAKRKNKKIAYKPLIDKKSKIIKFQIQKNEEIDFNASNGTIRKGNAQCLICGQITKVEMTRKLASEGKMGERLLIVILRHPSIKGKRYRLANHLDIEIFNQASEYLVEKIKSWTWECSPLPDEPIPPAGSLGVNLKSYGFREWQDLFNPRQKLALLVFLILIKKYQSEIEKECKDYLNSKQLVKAIMGYLTLILGRLADKNATLVVYNVYGEKIEHVFGRTALPMKWDYTELNVFSGGNGDWLAHTNWVVRFLKANLWESTSSITITQQSATNLSYPDSHFDAVLTDPPYYDNVPYADLSDFFYVWFKRAVGTLFPNLFKTVLTPKDKEIVANKARQKDPKEYFEQNMELAFKEMYRILKPNGIAVIVYAHKSIVGWEAMVTALYNAGFVVTASWPIQTEMKARLRAKTSSALSSSIYIACRKYKRKPSIHIEEIKPKIQGQIEKKFANYLNKEIYGGDYFLAAIGPALEIYTQFEKVKTHSGKSISANNLLQIIRTISTGYLIKKIFTSETNVQLDKLSQFYLIFRFTYMDKAITKKDIQMLAESCDTSIKELKEANGLIVELNSKFILQNASKRSYIGSEVKFIDIMHKALKFWSQKEFKKLNNLLIRTNILDNTLFWQYCQAIAECLNSGNKEKHLIEGMLKKMIRIKKIE